MAKANRRKRTLSITEISDGAEESRVNDCDPGRRKIIKLESMSNDAQMHGGRNKCHEHVTTQSSEVTCTGGEDAFLSEDKSSGEDIQVSEADEHERGSDSSEDTGRNDRSHQRSSLAGASHGSQLEVITIEDSSDEELYVEDVGSSNGKGDATPDTSCGSPQASPADAAIEYELIPDGQGDSTSPGHDHAIATAPLITRSAYENMACSEKVMQYGVLGRLMQISTHVHTSKPKDPRLYVNTNAPFSAVVCGLQGSGKSHTVSVMLENMFICNYAQIGSLQKPLCGLVLHYGEGGSNTRPSEAAWVGMPAIEGVQTPSVRVFVSQSSLKTMKRAYAPLGDRVVVKPFKFDRNELDAEAFLSLMCVGSKEHFPLYMQIFMSVLRTLGENFTFSSFMERLSLEKKEFNPRQKASLEQRISLLDTFLSNDDKPSARSRFAPGQITVIDLSDPFIDAEWACALFQIIIRLFVRANVDTGKVLVVDEAHKYLSESATGLTKSLLTLIREQRHLAMRVIISTQEPTVVPSSILGLSTVIILHRFSSPSWWSHLSKHASAESAAETFQKIVNLNTGEAIVLAPSGVSSLADVGSTPIPAANEDSIEDTGLCFFGCRHLFMKTRIRVTADVGGSHLVLSI